MLGPRNLTMRSAYGCNGRTGGAAIEARTLMNETMKAVVARNYGSPAVLTVEDVPIPRPGPRADPGASGGSGTQRL